jgi:hypothetical protein
VPFNVPVVSGKNWINIEMGWDANLHKMLFQPIHFTTFTGIPVDKILITTPKVEFLENCCKALKSRRVGIFSIDDHQYRCYIGRIQTFQHYNMLFLYKKHWNFMFNCWKICISVNIAPILMIYHRKYSHTSRF